MTRLEAILEARKLAGEKFFDRAIAGREPQNLDWDTVTLECGHTCVQSEAMQRLINEYHGGKLRCDDCVKAWIKQQTGEAR